MRDSVVGAGAHAQAQSRKLGTWEVGVGAPSLGVSTTIGTLYDCSSLLKQ